MTNFRSAVSLTCCCTTYSAFSWLSCWHWWEHILYYVYIHIQWYFAKGRVTFKLIVAVVVGWKQLMLEHYTSVWRLNVFGVHVESLHCISQRNYGCRDISECRLYCFLSDGKIGIFTHIWYVWFDSWYACLSVFLRVCCDVCIYASGLIGCISSFSYS